LTVVTHRKNDLPDMAFREHTFGSRVG
jgi:hypothetical protein